MWLEVPLNESGKVQNSQQLNEELNFVWRRKKKESFKYLDERNAVWSDGSTCHHQPSMSALPSSLNILWMGFSKQKGEKGEEEEEEAF